jgi:hypothetical protein
MHSNMNMKLMKKFLKVSLKMLKDMLWALNMKQMKKVLEGVDLILTENWNQGKGKLKVKDVRDWTK